MQQVPNFPEVADLRNKALRWVADRERYNTDELKSELARHFGHEILSIRMNKDRYPKFWNLVDHLSRVWTIEGIHIRLDEKEYRLTNYGRFLARESANAEISGSANAEVSGSDSIFFDLAISGALEGLTNEARVRRRRRSAWLANRFLQKRDKAGSLTCDKCGLDPAELTAGTTVSPRSLLDVHHTKPLEEGARQTTVDDLSLLCPTCHRLLHAVMRSGQRALTATTPLRN